MRGKNQWQGLPVEETVSDFIEEYEIPLMKVDSDIDVEEGAICWFFSKLFFDEAMKLLFKQ